MTNILNGAKTPASAWLRAGAVAGLAGGLAEVVFMAVYSQAVGMSGPTILSLITATFLPAAFAFGQLGAFDGLMIHFMLSIIIGVSFGALQYFLHNNRASVSYPLVAAVGAAMLIGIWAFNFFVLLPRINPAFVAYVPLGPSFVSKLSFGLCLGVFAKLMKPTGGYANALIEVSRVGTDGIRDI